MGLVALAVSLLSCTNGFAATIGLYDDAATVDVRPHKSETAHTGRRHARIAALDLAADLPLHVTVGICTRDRPESVVQALQSVLASNYPEFDVIVIDQSTREDASRLLMCAARGDTRLTYLRSNTAGSSVAHNIVCNLARGPIVAFTDDDCQVSPQWLGALVAHFQANPDVGQIFGVVEPGPHDPQQGFIPDHPVTKISRVSSPWLKWRERGIGANMAFRLDALRAAGPFDEMLGPGAPLHACLDGDMTYRILLSGYAVLNVPDARVIHHGFRSWAQGSPIMRNIGRGVAGAYMKHLRAGDLAITPTLVIEAIRTISWSRLIRLQPRSGMGRFLGYLSGLRASFQYPVDREYRLYAAQSPQSKKVYGGVSAADGQDLAQHR